jgi:hypothetical protein
MLETVRALPLFVSGYCYLLLEEQFVEKMGERRMMACVGVGQVVESARTHGQGIVNTVVN